jgi:hypothetical protein
MTPQAEMMAEGSGDPQTLHHRFYPGGITALFQVRLTRHLFGVSVGAGVLIELPAGD